MAGSWNLFDAVDLTADSESSPRTRGINTLQIHHATTTSYGALRALMAPGGRTVSANGGMANDGTLYEIVRTSDRRAFTSASSFDNQSLTVEVCNTTLGPEWGISAACRTRLARLAVGMYRAGILSGLYRGVGGIIGHSEVPGSYATACPGPDMHIDWIVAEAQRLYAAGDPGVAGGSIPKPIEIKKEDEDMTRLYMDKSNGHVRAINAATGHDYHIPSEAYLDLVIGNKFYDKWEPAEGGDRRADAGHYKIVGHNEFEYLRKIAAFQRGEISWEDTTK